MADLIPITFKASEEFSDWMCRQYGELDLSRSEFIRQCVRIAAPLLKERPELLQADDQRIAKYMPAVGNFLEILDKI